VTEINKKKLKTNRVIKKLEEEDEPAEVKVKSKKVKDLNSLFTLAKDELTEARDDFKGVIDKEVAFDFLNDKEDPSKDIGVEDNSFLNSLV
tara:strand:- start:863 stop:1135 length:273 start_codon:yes stop_codon:yes gene_type:complete